MILGAENSNGGDVRWSNHPDKQFLAVPEKPGGSLPPNPEILFLGVTLRRNGNMSS